jgi:anti-anti-sigma factor
VLEGDALIRHDRRKVVHCAASRRFLTGPARFETKSPYREGSVAAVDSHARGRAGTLGGAVQGDFQVEATRDGDTELIAIRGELDLASGPVLELELARVAAAQTRAVIVDLRRLEFMDSTGLSIIVRAHRTLAELECELCLVRGTPQVQRLLDLTGVAEHVRVLAAPEELRNGR